MNKPTGKPSTASSRSRQRSGAAASSSKEPHTFPYVSPAPNWDPAPLLPFTIIHPEDGSEFATYGIVDSGADSTALPVTMASPLGIDLDADCKTDTGMSAGGSTTQYIFTPGLEAEVVGHRFRITAVFMETPLILLGQEDFFRTFHTAFDRREETFTIRRH